MGKISDALNKYSKERTTIRVEKVTKADLDALRTYDRETGHLLKYNKESGRVDRRSMEVLRNRSTIQRLLDNKLILPGGKLTPEGLDAVKRLEEREETSRTKEITSFPSLVEAEKESAEFQQLLTQEEPPADKAPAEAQPIILRPWKKKKAPIDPIPFREVPQKAHLQSDEGLKDLDPELEEALLSQQPPERTPPEDDIKKDEVEEKTASVSAHPAAKEETVQKPVETSVTADSGQSIYNPTDIDKNLVSLLDPHSYEAEQFKILRTNILYPLSGKPPRSILVTSALPAEGKSFVASNLAISIALNINKHVLLMDCDLRKPELHQRFGFQETPGLSSYLSDEISLSSLLLKTEVNKLTILPGGPPPSNPSELMSSERMEALIEEVMNRYSDRLIVIDSPPPGIAAETGVLSRQVDGIVLVVKLGKTPKEQVNDLIETVGADKIIRTVINYTDHKSSKYYGYSKYGRYGKKYRK